MSLAFYLLSFGGAIGAFDVFYYHIYVCRLFTRPQSFAENITHAIRAALFAAFFFVIMFVDARGAWWWTYVGLCSVEICNSTLDTYLERKSRADQGGLPNGEYCLHVFLSTLIGAVMTSMLVSTFPAASEPTSIVLRRLDLPPMSLVFGYLSIAVGLAFFLFESISILVVGRAPRFNAASALNQ